MRGAGFYVIARSPKGDEAIQEPQSRACLWIASLRLQ